MFCAFDSELDDNVNAGAVTAGVTLAETVEYELVPTELTAATLK